MRRVGGGPEAPPQTFSITILNIHECQKYAMLNSLQWVSTKSTFFPPQIYREKSPNSGIFASPGSFLCENISLLIDVCSCNGLEIL